MGSSTLHSFLRMGRIEERNFTEAAACLYNNRHKETMAVKESRQNGQTEE